MEIYFGTPRDENDDSRLAEVLARCFGAPVDGIQKRFDLVGKENIRVLERGNDLSAGLWLIPMGQWFGGKSVPMTGVAAVGVAPEARGRGAALDLMKRTLTDLHEQEIPLSSLYPATQTLYRLSGYEQAGCRYKTTVAPKDIHVRQKGVDVHATGPQDQESLREIYGEFARQMNGHLDRGPYVWDRVFQARDQTATGYRFEEDGKTTGYVFFLAKNRETYGYDLTATDLICLTPRTGAAIWNFLADHRSMTSEITTFAGPTHPLFFLLSEQPFRTELQILWMTRIVHLTRALEQRGYPAGLRARLDLEIEDDLLPGNHGRFVLEVEDGTGKVTSGGEGTFRSDIQALVPVYSGFLSPTMLWGKGRIDADPKTLDTAASIFSGPAPWMPDMF